MVNNEDIENNKAEADTGLTPREKRKRKVTIIQNRIKRIGANQKRNALIDTNQRISNRAEKRHSYRISYDEEANRINVDGETNALQEIMISELFK